MGTLNRPELDRLERRELQLTILSIVFVLILASGLAMFMYPLVFLHPIGNKWTLRVAFFGFCALTLLFVGYLLERQRTVRQLKQQLLAELERNVTLQQQASVDLLQSMPDQNYFWDRFHLPACARPVRAGFAGNGCAECETHCCSFAGGTARRPRKAWQNVRHHGAQLPGARKQRARTGRHREIAAARTRRVECPGSSE